MSSKQAIVCPCRGANEGKVSVSISFYTYDDDFSTPGQVKTIEGAGYYPQAGINLLTGLSLRF